MLGDIIHREADQDGVDSSFCPAKKLSPGGKKTSAANSQTTDTKESFRLRLWKMYWWSHFERLTTRGGHIPVQEHHDVPTSDHVVLCGRKIQPNISRWPVTRCLNETKWYLLLFLFCYFVAQNSSIYSFVSCHKPHSHWNHVFEHNQTNNT